MKKLLLGIIIILLIPMIAGCKDDRKDDKGKMEDTNPPADLTGTWNGQIEVPNQPLEITLKFSGDEGSISIPMQNLEDFSLSNITVKDKQVSFDMPLSGQKIHFAGTVKVDQITGTFTQNGQDLPFSAEKGETSQEEADKEDFLSIETNNGTLYGSVLTPGEGKKYPVALIIPGSGPTDRNGNSPGLPGKNNSLKLLAEGLKENGIASVRYDKRGAGKNAQAITVEEDMRFDQFIADAKQWIGELQKDERFSDVIIIGHSQGSLVGMVAAEDSDVDAFISIAGAGRPINRVLAKQMKSLPDDLYSESQQILDQLQQGKTVCDVSDPLMSAFKPSVQPFLISWMTYNPAEEIKQIDDIPTLIINGKNDLQVSIDDAKKLAEAKPEATLLLIDKMNHVLKEAPADEAGNMATYSDPTLPLADGLLEGINEFLEKQAVK